MNDRMKWFIVAIVVLLSVLACGGAANSLDPAGNAQITTDGETTIYKYPDNDSVDYCIVKNGTYRCEMK